MPVQFILCDVFADRPFAGKQLAVFLDGSSCSDGDMAALANEFGWSETTFVLWDEGAVPRVRIWTPHGELPFAGHSTVGTAVALAAKDRIPVGTSVLELGIGEVIVDVTEVSDTGGRASMMQGPAHFGRASTNRSLLAGALSLEEGDLAPGLDAQVVSTGFDCLLVPVASLDALERASIVPDLLDRIAGDVGVPLAYVFTVETPQSMAAARARLLGVGVEDAATGGAAGALGAYLVQYGLHRAGVLDIEQGIEIERPSRLTVSVHMESGEVGTVAVSGAVRIWAEGSLAAGLPDHRL